MGRLAKKGLDYFPMDVDMFQDIKVRKLIRRQGGKSISVYVCLLCLIYESGYYIGEDEDLPFIISERTGLEEAYIQETLRSCLSIGLLDSATYERHQVYTSRGIQERYKNVCTSSKRVARIEKYNLISSEEKGVSSEEKGISSEEKGISSEEKGISSEFMPQSKSKIKRKEKKKERESREKAADASFLPPSLSEVLSFIRDEGLQVDGDRFFNFYESNGWMTGKSKMRDWRAACRTWSSRETRKPPNPQVHIPTAEEVAAREEAERRRKEEERSKCISWDEYKRRRDAKDTT